MDELPLYVWLLVCAGVLAVPLALAAVFRRANAVAWGAVAILGVWYAADWLLADAGAYNGPASARVSPGLAVALLGCLALLLGAARLPAARRALAGEDAVVRLTLPQTLRVVGVVFLIVLALGKLPAAFALPAGLGDVAVGISAPFVARGLRRRSGRAERRAMVFHVLGIADLVIAVSMGVVSGLLGLSPSMNPITVMPLVLIPTLAVPTDLVLHVLALRRLRAARPHPVPSAPVREGSVLA
jgi:hypothetical protein